MFQIKNIQLFVHNMLLFVLFGILLTIKRIIIVMHNAIQLRQKSLRIAFLPIKTDILS